MKKEIKKPWWKSPPRSSRICFICSHKYSSHIDVRCLKVVNKKPRKECSCKGFILNEVDFNMLSEYKKNTLKGLQSRNGTE